MARMSPDTIGKSMLVSFQQLTRISELQLDIRSSHTTKQRAIDFFAALDADEDGYITKDELLQSRIAANLGKKLMRRMFEGLDADYDGYISFQETMPIFYLSMCTTRKCKTCQISLVYGLAFSCIQCIQNPSSPSDFSICHRCFISQRFQHPQHDTRHILHDFNLFHKLLDMAAAVSRPSVAPAPPLQQSAVQTTMQQCIVCGDFHTSPTKGFMCDVHMTAISGSSNYVCEWCFCYFCFKCGNPFRDNVKCATPAKWLQRFVCLTCSQQQPQPSRDLYHVIIQRYQHLLNDAEIMEHCKTCQIKQKNGTLFWYVNGTNKLDTNNASIVPVRSSPSFQDNSHQILQNQPHGITVQRQSLPLQGHRQYRPPVQTLTQSSDIGYREPQLQQPGQFQSQVLNQMAGVATSVASNVAFTIGKMFVADIANDLRNDS